ncbi:MAG: metallophosphoesterase [Clostridia bacterium]|nr:metallophosphoesterase [Clostridia bacterium]
MKKTVIALLVLALLLPCAAAYTVFAAENKGMTFNADTVKQTKAPAMPLTWEARIKVAKNAGNGRLGTIVGNFSNSTTVSMNLELRDNGAVALYWNNGSTSPRYDFTSYDIRTGEPVNIAVTIDPETKAASLYVEGELKQTIQTAITAVKLPNGLVVGGDLRDSNTQYLKNSELFSVALYSDVRTEAELKADLNGPDIGDENLIAAYDLTSGAPFTDLSKNKNDLKKETKMIYNAAEDPDTRGMYFTADALCTTDIIVEMPKTFEAWVKVPEGYNERAGIILGNYEGTAACVNFEISTRGAPRIYFTDSNGRTTEQIFSCDVRTGDWAHVAIVNDSDNTKLLCYINGALAQTVSKTMSCSVPEVGYCIGGDRRSGNGQYFKGKISSVTVFSGVRTAEQIASDMQNVDLTAEGLIAHYDLNGRQNALVIEDGSGNGHDAEVLKNWIEPENKQPLEDYAYSMAIIGDIQVLTFYAPDKLHYIFDWLTENAEKTKLKYVLGLGDTTERDTAQEWKLTKEQYDRLNGIVPYSIVRGNHDSSAGFNKYFGDEAYKATYTESYDEKIENTARIVQIGMVKYLILTLDYGAADKVLDWAGKVIESHPDCNVIVTTHCYLFRDGTTLDANDVCPPTASGGYNNGDHMWEKFVSKHRNISLVISGHDPCDNVVVTRSEGAGGATVTQMLVDPQGMDLTSPAGMICMLYFSEDGTQVQVEYYSAIRDRYFKKSNQTSFTLETTVCEHTYGEWVTEKEPGIGEEGLKRRVCSKCGHEETETIPALEAPVSGEEEPTEPETEISETSKENDESGSGMIVPVIIAAVAAAAIAAAVIIIKKKKK